MRKLLACVLVLAGAAAAGGARANVVTDWNTAAVTTAQRLGLPTPLQSRPVAVAPEVEDARARSAIHTRTADERTIESDRRFHGGEWAAGVEMNPRRYA
jgi:hypothetical protein